MKGYYNTFVVRIRTESENRFTGSIQHVSSQEQVHFDAYEDMQNFILNHLRPLANGVTPETTTNTFK